MGYVQDHLKDQFTTIEGVGQVFLGGYVDKNLRVWLDDKKLRQYQITADDVVNTIQQQHIELPAGRIETPTKEKNVRMLGAGAQARKILTTIIIEKRTSGPVYKAIKLKDVAHAEYGLDDVRRIAH